MMFSFVKLTGSRRRAVPRRDCSPRGAAQAWGIYLSSKISSNDADGDAFDRKRRLLRVYDNRRKGGVLRGEHDIFSAALQPLDGDLVSGQSAQSYNNDLSGARFAGLVHGQQIAVENAGIAHRQAGDAQQIIGARRKKLGIDAVMRLDVLGSKEWCPGRYATHERQDPLDGNAGQIFEPQAARRARLDFEHAFFLQRAQVIFSGAGRGKAQTGGDFGARWRTARRFKMAANPIEDLALARRQLRRSGR